MHPAIYVILLGLALSVVSWLWFRLPGQAFWFKAPVWRASRHLKPAGAKLWAAGSAVSLAGFVWLLSGLLLGLAA